MAKRYDIETEALEPISGQPEVISIPAQGPIIIPGGGLMADAVYARLDGDLLIELADGSQLIISGYFDQETPPPLATEAGAHLGPDVVTALAGGDITHEVDQTPVVTPIGRVETVEGEVTILRADGSRVDAEAGVLIARGDQIFATQDGSAGLLFADETTFSVGGSGRATFEDLLFDPDTGAAQATFVVQEGTFSFAAGGIAAYDGAFVIKTPSATIGVDGASGAGRVEADGAASVTYLRADDAGSGVIRVSNPGGTELLDNSYETTLVEDFFASPSSTFRLGPRDAVEHFGDAVTALPDAEAMMPTSLLRMRRGDDPASQALRSENPEAPGLNDTFADEIQVDRDTAFEIAARKAAISRAARDAAEQAIGDATAAEDAARRQALEADARADAQSEEAAQLRDKALDILEESERRDQAFEQAVLEAENAAQQEENAARDVAETDLAEAQAAERLATAEEAVRRALEAAEQARNEALQILEEAKQKEEAFAEAQRLASEARAEEEARALAVAEADAAEEAAAAALRAAEAAAEASRRDAEVAERVAQEASTAAEIVETVVERELSAIDPSLLEPPAPGDPASTRGDWITNIRASMNVATAAIAAGDDAARLTFQNALRDGSSVQDALSRAIAAAEAYGGPSSADRVIAAGPDGLIERGEDEDSIQLVGGDGGFSGTGGDVGPVESEVLLGSGGEDALGAGFGFSGPDGFGGFGFSFTPIFVNLPTKIVDDERNDFVATAQTVTVSNTIQGTSLADFLVGDNTASTIGGSEADDFIYGDTPTNYLSGTHNISNALTNPTFSAGGNDLISGGAGNDSIWGGEGDDTLYGDVPADTSAFGFDLGATTAGDDHLLGGGGNDTLHGGGGADMLDGEGGDDTFILGDDDGANDTVRGGDGSADSGTDTVDYSGAGAAINGNLDTGNVTGTATGTDTLTGIEHILGTDFGDTLTGSADDNSLSGNGGNDTLYGLGGADNIFGYADDDVLVGGQGADTLTGGSGSDTYQFEGGSGATNFDRVSSLGLDIIADYNASEADLFMLSDTDFGLGNSGTLTQGTNYFEAATTAINTAPQNISGGAANAGIVVLGSANGGDGAEVWYTTDASAMTDSNSYQIANVSGADRSTIEAGDFSLKS